MMFIIYEKDGSMRTYSSRYDNEDSAWGDVYAMFPDADYIETL